MYETTGKTRAVLALSAAIVSGGVVAHGGSESGRQGMMGHGQGHGMMGQGQEMMGQGHGMMGQGQEMMGQGHGMMGQGQGMMGQGMMGPYVSGVLGLSADQLERLEEIQRENASEHWQLMQEMQQH